MPDVLLGRSLRGGHRARRVNVAERSGEAEIETELFAVFLCDANDPERRIGELVVPAQWTHPADAHRGSRITASEELDPILNVSS